MDEAGLQVKPPGMNGIVLPWADDIRDPPQTSLVSGERVLFRITCNSHNIIVEEDVLDAAEGIVENLTMDDPFSSHHYQNPSLQLFYNNIEALALGRIKTDNIQDKTLPNLERFSDLSDSFDQLKLLVSNGLSTALPSPKTKKARKVSDGSAEVLGNDAGKQQFDLDDLRAMKQAGTLGKKLKVAELKEILQEMFSVSSSELKGLKKNDLVEKLMEKL